MIERSQGQRVTLHGEQNEWFQVARGRVNGRMVHREIKVVVKEEDGDWRGEGQTMAFILWGRSPTGS